MKSDDYPIYTYGIDNKNTSIYAKNITQMGGKSFFDVVFGGNIYHAVIPAMGKHNILNALCAFLVGTLCDIESSQIIKSLSDYKPTGMRQNIVEHQGITWVEDCYNASPDSMRAAIKTFVSMPCQNQRYLVLSDMLELGDRTVKEHIQVGHFAKEAGDLILLATGELGNYYLEGYNDKEKSHYFATKEALFEYIKEQSNKGDIFWFKASRGAKLEDIIQRIYKEC